MANKKGQYLTLVDFRNSVSMADLLHHFSHDCPLTCPDTATNGVCNICYKDKPVGFACNPCKFDLCKPCFDLPQNVSHDFHEHSLEFCLREYDRKPDYIVCSGCGNMSSESFYECKECEIYLDLHCASQENILRGWESKEILHYSHSHLLRRSRPGPDVRGSSCLLCELPLSPSAVCYGCVHCYSFFHERCLDLPMEFQHPAHPSHPIRRLDYTQTLGGGKKCGACGEDIVGVPFGCLECKFNLHLRCADSLLRGLMHESHEHKLFYVSTNAYEVFGEESVCQICLKIDAISLYSYYRCVECGLKFHFECLEIPESVVKKSNHVHPLLSKIFLPEGDDSLEYCGVCEAMVYAGHHAYSCNECDFLGHIECILTEEAPSPLYLKDLYTCCDDIKRPIIQVDCETNKLMVMVNGIEHVHVLRPVHMSEVDESENCNICAGKILGTPYKCETCSFQTHHYCAELGRPSRHRFHQNHPLTLLPKPPAGYKMNCDKCKHDIDGFILFCRFCDFIIDIACALKGKDSLRVYGQKVIGTVRGRCVSDKHNMVQVIISSTYQISCAICDDRLYGKALSCIECEEIYHHGCIDLGRKRLLRHPLHSSHWLEISLTKGSKCIACTLCITNYGYSCSTCNINFHVKCINEASLSGKIGSHSHKLYHFSLDDEARTCSVCGRPCDGSFYGCIDCNFNAHVACIGYPDNVKNQLHKHTLTLKNCKGKDFCSYCKVECGDKMIYACNHCRDIFHPECIMPNNPLEGITKEKRDGDISRMRLELETKNGEDEVVRRLPPQNQLGVSQAHLEYMLYGY